MPLIKSNFARWMGLVATIGVGGVAALPPSGTVIIAGSVGSSPLVNTLMATGQLFLTGSVLFVYNGTNFTGFSANISASGS
jgi:hypothetical protein